MDGLENGILIPTKNMSTEEDTSSAHEKLALIDEVNSWPYPGMPVFVNWLHFGYSMDNYIMYMRVIGGRFVIQNRDLALLAYANGNVSTDPIEDVTGKAWRMGEPTWTPWILAQVTISLP